MVDQCQQIERELKDEYGEDFMTNREAFPLTSQTLTYLASTPCESHFKYADLVSEYCTDINHFKDQVGNGQTCADKVSLTTRSEWCLLSDTGQANGERLKSDAMCSSSKLGNQYHSTAARYCQSNSTDEWCACYNLKNKVCDTNSSAAGCGYYKQLEENRSVFGKEPKIEDPQNPGRMIECSPSATNQCPHSEGYNILKDKAHCRPRACDNGYIPENVKADCAPSYHFCDKDINIKSMTNNDIVIECNGPGELILPDWWDQEFDDSFFDDVREPPFDTFPLNKTPITRWPSKFIWKNKNVRYLTYTAVCCVVFIILIFMFLFSSKNVNYNNNQY